MKCGICKAEMEERGTTYTEDVGDRVVVIRNVPGYVCKECGNIWYKGNIAAQLQTEVDRIIDSTRLEVAVGQYAVIGA
jgi:YgiT-type zinc finger domain-containing protein